MKTVLVDHKPIILKRVNWDDERRQERGKRDRRGGEQLDCAVNFNETPNLLRLPSTFILTFLFIRV